MLFRTHRNWIVALGFVLGLPSSAATQSGDTIEILLERGEYASALRQAEVQSANGDAEAGSWLAHMHRQGLGVPQDLLRAVELDQAAAASGVARSQNALGHSFVLGLGVAPDPGVGLDWLHRAAQAGDAQYEFDYAQALSSDLTGSPDFVEAANWYRRAAEQGLIEAQTNLGILYMTGDGVPQDFDRARTLFIASAEAGDAQAQNNLGLLYVRGDGVTRDYDAAFQWFRLAADQDLPQALRNLSVLYESGQGAPVDETQARQLLDRARILEGAGLDQLLSLIGFPLDRRLREPEWAAPPDRNDLTAAEGGDAVALYLQGHRLMRGGGVRQDLQAARSLFEAAAGQGFGSADFSLCLLHANGWGVPQNYRSAYVRCSLAAYRGYPDADLVRDSLALQMTGDQVDDARQEVTRRLSSD
ncbi:tetratricopeptide repeat protein [Maricaulis maris]|jgi:TPR repeat protein|uniref:tetratricopeptide repeat protein n=1 Tax=Maricaulis maris TaxID=74318 RepID=UPI0026EE6081|nr:tetratricopeptide repeat protein [Maricaulis maris]